MITKQQLLEYSKGQKIAGSAYIQRIGTPGNYIYIYPVKKVQNLGRKYRRAYARFIRKSRKFLTKLSTRYEATSMNIKPKNWYTAIVKMKTKTGGTIDFKINFKTNRIKSYRSVNMGTGGASSQLAKSKRKGLLRYR